MKIEISSRANPRLKELLERKEEFVFFEGEKLVGDVLSRRLTVSKLLCSAEMERRLPEITATVVEFWVVSPQVLEKVSGLKTPPAIIAVLEFPVREIDFKSRKVVFGFDTVQDPANLGTVFRCASAFGVSALAMAGAGVRANHPKVVRAAQTALLDVPFQVFPSLPLKKPWRLKTWDSPAWSFSAMKAGGWRRNCCGASRRSAWIRKSASIRSMSP
jgi:tRNA G18 (ribose-2'-O)-methylase SpoU